MKTPRVRLTTAPLEELARRRRLDPDPVMAAAMLSAGRKYQSLWHRAGMSPLKGQDPGAIRTTAIKAGFMVGPDGLESSERFVEAYRAYRAASDAMIEAQRIAVDRIVLHEHALVDVGWRIGRGQTIDKASRITLASYELKNGLQVLALHFGLIASLKVVEPDPSPVPDGLPPEMAALLAAMDAREAQPA